MFILFRYSLSAVCAILAGLVTVAAVTLLVPVCTGRNPEWRLLSDGHPHDRFNLVVAIIVVAVLITLLVYGGVAAWPHSS